MPSLSNLAHYTLVNLGSLTTPFTAAPACETATATAAAKPQHHMVGQLPWGMVADPRCPNDTGPWHGDGCFPSAAQVASLIAGFTRTETTATIPDPDGGTPSTVTNRFIPRLAEYFSPGVQCPTGWTTAGTLAYPAVATPAPTTDDGTARPSITAPPHSPDGVGLFTAAVNYTERNEWDRPFSLALGEVLARALEPGETLAFCCPSDYEGYHNGFCVSTLGPASDAGFTEVCWPGTDSPLSLEYTPVTATNGPFSDVTGPLTAYTVKPVVPLIYRASDLDLVSATARVTSTASFTGTLGPWAGGPYPTGTGAEGGGADATPVPNAGPRTAPGEGFVSWMGVTAALISLLGGAGAILL